MILSKFWNCIFAIMKWLDRQWSFGEYSQMYLENLERMESASKQIESLCSALDDEYLRKKPDGKWSINEHAGHLLTIESLWIARLDDFVLGRESLRPWNGTNADTDAGEFNRQRFGKILEDLDDIRYAHVKMLRGLTDKKDIMSVKHPRLNTTLTLADHVHFMAEHDQHHISTIQEIINQFS